MSCAVWALTAAVVRADPQEPTHVAQAAGVDDVASHAWDLPQLPRYTSGVAREWYPDAARGRDAEGRVLLGFDITDDGRAANVSVIWSENRMFDSSAVGLVRSVHFKVPTDWARTGALTRWRLGVVYRLSPGSCQSDAFAIPVQKVYITGSRLGRIVTAPLASCARSSAQ